MKYFEPVVLKSHYWEDIEKDIEIIFNRIFYIPLSTVIKIEIVNASDSLADAIREGKIYYVDGLFYGQFNSQISAKLLNIGAKYNGKKKGFFLNRGNLPLDVIKAIRAAEDRYTLMLKNVQEMLKEIESRADEYTVYLEKIKNHYGNTISLADREFLRTLSSLGVVPTFTKEAKERISTEWANNTDLYIKKWKHENIIALRKNIKKNTLSGHRSEGMIKLIQSNYKTSKAKARFLARQETSLLLSKMREIRYQEANLPEYKWSGIMDARERPIIKEDWKNPLCNNHRILEGKIFSWNLAPVVDGKTGRRAHPGCDYGCRCVAVPVIRDLNGAIL